MRHSVVGCFAGLLLCACVSATPKGEILSLSPSTVTAGDVPFFVLIKGRGLGDVAELRLDDKGSARITAVTVEVGGELATVIGRPNRDAIEAEFPPLPPGDHDVRVLAGSELSAELLAAFRVEPKANETDANVSFTSNEHDSSDDTTAEMLETWDETNQTSNHVSNDERVSTDDRSDVTSQGGTDRSESEGVRGDAALSELADAASDAEPSEVTVSEAGDATADAQAPGALCANTEGTLLFYDDYESGDFSRWTYEDNVGQGSCQDTIVSDERVFEGELAFSSTLTCAPGNEAEHYAALQFDGDELLSDFDEDAEGIDAPLGVVISFDVWAELGFSGGTDQWLSFVLLSGSCDWSDTVFSVATTGVGEPIGISHGDVDGGVEYDYDAAPVAARAEWSRVTIYVNYYEEVLSVWQDGVLSSRAEFVRPGNTLCHIWLGAGFGPESVDSQVYQDNVMVWRLSEALVDPDVEPCLAEEENRRRNWQNGE